MTESILICLAGIIVLGVTAQWLAWRIGLPSILLLLVFGVVAGPVTGWLHPDELFGDLLLPIVSIAVALILYEGGLSLKFSELTEVGATVRNLVSIGAAVTWAIASFAAHYLLGFGWHLSALLGAILIVTGPTVIGPLLRQIRPSGNVGPILKWEGIVIDPIGAVLAVLVYEAMLIGEAREASWVVLLGLLKTVVLGGGIGLLAAGLLVLLLARYWVADYLQNAVSLMLVVAAFVTANHCQDESGLLAVTVMGFFLANQKRVDVRHIVEFKENLQVLLIASVFIVLAARLQRGDFSSFGVREALFIGVLIVVARPLSVFVATWRSGLPVRQRLFFAWMAPRGIVAAAVASVFALKLEAVVVDGVPVFPEAAALVPVTFLTIIATVTVYGLSSAFVGRKLGVAEAHPQGILFAGGHNWVQEIASTLQREGFRVLLVDNNRDNTNTARMAGLPAYTGSILAEQTLDDLDLGGIGHMVAVTPNDWVNVLAVRRFQGIFGRAECYQLSSTDRQAKKKARHKYLYGRRLFRESINHDAMQHRLDQGFVVKATPLSTEFDYAAYCVRYGEMAVPLFLVDEKHHLNIITSDDEVTPQPGHTLIGFVKETPGPVATVGTPRGQ